MGLGRGGDNVTVEFAEQSKTTMVGAGGKWMLKLEPLAASGESREMRVRSGGGDPRVIRDVIVGEVWMGSGQSNMEQMMFSQNPAGGCHCRESHAPAVHHHQADVPGGG